jgi:DNA-binding PadR family transcriptional regulator
LLALLAEHPMHGYEMIQELDTRTGGFWRPSPGSVYPRLRILEDEGLIAGEQEEGRKRFALTEAGRNEAAKAEESAPWSDYADSETVAAAREFRNAAIGIMDALCEVGYVGSAEQHARALEILIETRRNLYALLAEGD